MNENFARFFNTMDELLHRPKAGETIWAPDDWRLFDLIRQNRPAVERHFEDCLAAAGGSIETFGKLFMSGDYPAEVKELIDGGNKLFWFTLSLSPERVRYMELGRISRLRDTQDAYIRAADPADGALGA